MNVVNQYDEKRNCFAEVAAFCHVTCRYFDRFLPQGVDRNRCQACLFYLAPGLICEGYWQVNSGRLIFRIVDPTIACVEWIQRNVFDIGGSDTGSAEIGKHLKRQKGEV